MTALDLVSSRAFRSAGKVVNLVTKMRKLQSLIVAITFCITLGYSTTSCERRKVLSANEELRLPSDQLKAYKLKAEHGDAEAAKKLWHHYTFVAGDPSQGKKWKKAFEGLTKKDDPSFGHIYELPHSLKSTDTAEAQPKETQALLDADWLRSTTEVNAASTTSEEPEVSKNVEIKSLSPLRTVAVSSITTEPAMAHETTVMQLLSDGPGPLQRKLANVPSCVLRGLRHWYEKPFVFVEKGQSFPEIRDIRRAGDGRFRLLFFAELKNGNSVLSFEDHTSLGITHRAVIFRRDRGHCSVVTDFAFDLPLNSLDQLRVAINTQKNERSE